jgi:hypothetical protein
MASNFSVSLREMARLYLRYMMVGLVSVPLGLLYALAKRANWNASAVSAGLLLVGCVSAFFFWRRLGDWQVKPVPTNFDACWADLLQQTAIMDSESLRLRKLTVVASAEIERLKSELDLLSGERKIKRERFETSWNQLLETQMRTAQSTDTLQYFCAQADGPTNGPSDRPSVRPEPTRQRQPAWAFALDGQSQAHGLA